MVRFWLPFAALLLSFPALADTITGQVVDSNGVGVPGVNINVKNLGAGGDPVIFNDGTDASGFFTTTVPAGFYRVSFIPPPPPVSTHLVLEVDDVVVVGTTPMGVLMLPQGVGLSGTIQMASGIPVAGVNLDIIEEGTGNNLPLTGDSTDAFGTFSIAVPPGPIEVRLDTTAAAVGLLAPKSISLDLAASTDVGIWTVEPGYLITATILGPGALPVEQIDVDAINLVTDEELFTPGDNSDASGFLDCVVPAGVYDFVFCAPNGVLLAPAELRTITVPAVQDLGTIQLLPGLELSGTVTDPFGNQLSGVDVDVRDQVTGASLPLCGDNTNGSGQYSVLVPAGLFEVTFVPSYALPLGSDVWPNISVGGNVSLDGSLPSCPFPDVSRGGIAGSQGIQAQITSIGGSTRSGNSNFGVHVKRGVGGGFGVLMASGLGSLPAYGPHLSLGGGSGILIGQPTVFVPFSMDGTPGLAGDGTAQVPLPIPSGSGLVGNTLLLQALLRDSAVPGGFSLTPVLYGTICN